MVCIRGVIHQYAIAHDWTQTQVYVVGNFTVDTDSRKLGQTIGVFYSGRISVDQ